MYSPHVHPNAYVDPGRPLGPRATARAQAAKPGRDLEPEERLDDRPKRERKMITIADLMQTDVLTVSPEMPVTELAQRMQKHGVSGFPVVARDGELLGVVSYSDIGAMVSQLPAQKHAFYKTLLLEQIDESDLAEDVTVEEIMTPFVFYATEDTNLTEVMDLMLDNGIHRVVVTRQSKLVGLVSTMDLLAHFRASL